MWGKKLGHGVKLRKNLVNTHEVTFLTQFSSNLIRIFVSVKSRSRLNVGNMGSKTRSWGQIKGKLCKHSIRGHNFDQILIKLGQNVCLKVI